MDGESKVPRGEGILALGQRPTPLLAVGMNGQDKGVSGPQPEPCPLAGGGP